MGTYSRYCCLTAWCMNTEPLQGLCWAFGSPGDTQMRLCHIVMLLWLPWKPGQYWWEPRPSGVLLTERMHGCMWWLLQPCRRRHSSAASDAVHPGHWDRQASCGATEGWAYLLTPCCTGSLPPLRICLVSSLGTALHERE